jgi:hypothetical protein
MISMISTEVLGSSEDVGSSARRSSGRCMMARAMPTRWRWPPESASARWLAKAVSPTASSSSQAALMSSWGYFLSHALSGET